MPDHLDFLMLVLAAELLIALVAELFGCFLLAVDFVKLGEHLRIYVYIFAFVFAY